MKFMVGLQTANNAFLDHIIKRKEHIYEVYFSWGDFANGRNSQIENSAFLPWDLQQKQIEALRRLSQNNIALNLLFNANCYGRDSLSRSFFQKIGDTVDYIVTRFGLQSVTTTSPLIAKFIKQNFSDIEVRASVNMGIGTTQGMDYVSNLFDSFYLQRELNRNFDKIAAVKKWCDTRGKRLYLLANSGCLNHCSAHTFHDNLVSHESELAKMDNAYEFHGICREYLKNPAHLDTLITDTSFIRPEDTDLYAPFVPAVKLATRIHKNPCLVLESYIRRKYSGDILALLEPAHSIYPYVLENGNPLKLVKLNEEL